MHRTEQTEDDRTLGGIAKTQQIRWYEHWAEYEVVPVLASTDKMPQNTAQSVAAQPLGPGPPSTSTRLSPADAIHQAPTRNVLPPPHAVIDRTPAPKKKRRGKPRAAVDLSLRDATHGRGHVNVWFPLAVQCTECTDDQRLEIMHAQLKLLAERIIELQRRLDGGLIVYEVEVRADPQN